MNRSQESSETHPKTTIPEANISGDSRNPSSDQHQIGHAPSIASTDEDEAIRASVVRARAHSMDMDADSIRMDYRDGEFLVSPTSDA